jgi:hypothetical protein
MNNQHTEETSIVASSPVVQETGLLPHRIVIRDLDDQYVVHTEVFEPKTKPWYHQGDYIPKLSDVPTAKESDAQAMRKAWARFEERARRSLRMDPPPDKRLGEVADIAETIVKTLLPDDEDDCRDLIEPQRPISQGSSQRVNHASAPRLCSSLTVCPTSLATMTRRSSPDLASM